MKILVIDDDDLVQHTLTRILQANGYDVVAAGDGGRGMSLFRGAAPDIVITDIIMPEQEGFETIRQMRRERPHTKIIAISGSVQTGPFDVLALARKLGADEVLRKPFDAAELLSRVR